MTTTAASYEAYKRVLEPGGDPDKVQHDQHFRILRCLFYSLFNCKLIIHHNSEIVAQIATLMGKKLAYLSCYSFFRRAEESVEIDITNEEFSRKQDDDPRGKTRRRN